MGYRYLDDFRRGISVFANFSYGIAVLGTPQCPPHDCVRWARNKCLLSVLTGVCMKQVEFRESVWAFLRDKANCP